MPDETVYLTEIEMELLSVFVKRELLGKEDVVSVLKALQEKASK